MALKIIVEKGARAGEEFTVRSTIIIGRSRADLALRDPKASGQHARITLTEDGAAFLEDLNSSNGTFLNGQKIEKSQIYPGDEISIGNSQMRISDPDVTDSTDQVFEQGSWQDIVDKALVNSLNLKPQAQARAAAARPLAQRVKLTFTEGCQLDEVVEVAFGPKIFGALGPDFLLFDPRAPDQAFEVGAAQIGGGAEFRNKNREVLLNGKPVNVQVMRDGDEITFGKTKIVVNFGEK